MREKEVVALAYQLQAFVLSKHQFAKEEITNETYKFVLSVIQRWPQALELSTTHPTPNNSRPSTCSGSVPENLVRYKPEWATDRARLYQDIRNFNHVAPQLLILPLEETLELITEETKVLQTPSKSSKPSNL